MADKTIAHFGVLGMKWGVRRTQPTQHRSNKTDASNTKRRESELWNSPKQIVVNLLGAGAGGLGARSLLSLTDAQLSSTAMYIGTLLGMAVGARLMNTIRVDD